MKHKKKGRKFGRKRDQRQALLKGLAANLILMGKITTTEAKAKEVRPVVEKLITKSKKQNLVSIRYLAKYLPVKARKKIMELGQRYQERQGGYTRIIKLGPRKRDSAKMAIIEFV
ncbi:MAG: 50S ribosomal protein L17 [Candidatus Portnoybacteria bacterium RIFCSPLOWO2_12_FULL_39_9]|uniref:50S ribosomal protein L17 n=1 Tax=Candidatus Portnoybacteria bacterium RIFCSPHIGHO2_12_FULL_38_9 TaxID=1801997 RepID=A0A1G2FFD7_9BACT|nr:MAG: 50S ribosomal protein L17 [Candidatus Portnoybacteria bacterium RBG_13_40_8]OGZ36159.1 MAG: 50S ribosomal protein L17 [Candidatus Portnoybacteria bacterium RIFCSPHIGHO2_02_FULL_39_12]OGZ36517.1 MAG: 50S ribosomal protein L17 [Candidatus Portnoybacteria bacterium RIFCSPHIGHO2_12_FULL_38_9]OGZ38526.1 MAG: 50S ribosomal protein L17 [Candidatus Portnoybacteria bacterium RIFCSPLOWO2_01_FULL_38_39]OGZ41295.1 MAG: 50S ribosomal protein L17 [Candidatus Portnoybacteria bacterium RIFCSPLOWO2_12_F